MGSYEAENECDLDDWIDDLESDEPALETNDESKHSNQVHVEDHQYPSSQLSQVHHTHSQFSHHDLRLMGRSATTSPLRVIALIDFDAFYAQCETVRLGLSPEKPLAVRQWNAIIALNYPARKLGLKRGMSVNDCMRVCPELKLQHVATWRDGDERWAYRDDRDRMSSEKAALEPYREESRKAFALIADCLSTAPLVLLEKASVDEMYLDLSAYVHGILLEQYPELAVAARLEHDKLPLPTIGKLEWGKDNVIEAEMHPLDWDDMAIKIGADVVRGLRQSIQSKLGYTTSAGIASNKVLAKLGAGAKKPNSQTIIRPSAVPLFLSSIPYKKIRGLGRQLGQAVEDSFGGITVNDILHVPLSQMQSALGIDTGEWVHNVIRGVEYGEVSPRSKPQSMLSQKTFTPPIPGMEQASYWLRMFATELCDRVLALDTPTSRRRPRTLALNHHINGRFGPTRRKQASFPVGSNLSSDLIYNLASKKLHEISVEGVSWPCAALGVVISNFVELESGSQSIKSFFKPGVERSVDLPTSIENNSRFTASREVFSSEGSKLGKVPDIFSKQRQSNSQSEGYLCPNCQTRIPEATVLEHLDWHMAKDLQAEG